MKPIIPAVIIATLVCLPSSLESKEPAASAPEKKAAVQNVSPDEAEKLIKDVPGLIVLDVRTPEEFKDGHIKGAKNIDFFDSNFEKQVAALDHTKPVLVHCAVGGRSGQALGQMKNWPKFPAVYHLKDGFNGWTAAKKPVEKKK